MLLVYEFDLSEWTHLDYLMIGLVPCKRHGMQRRIDYCNQISDPWSGGGDSYRCITESGVNMGPNLTLQYNRSAEILNTIGSHEHLI